MSEWDAAKPNNPRSPRISSDRLNYAIEQKRHAGFVGREAMLARLDQLLLAHTDRWVVITGGPGMGKSAILTAWLAHREVAGAIVPHHFIRRGEGGWDEPARIMGSLAAQIEACYPDQRDPNAPPESRLVDLLTRVSARELVPRDSYLVVLVDGLDEYDAPADAYNPLAAFLPPALPHVRLLCASRPRHPYLDALAVRGGTLIRIDLDDPIEADDNDATVRVFWRREAPTLALEEQFVDEATARADGNMQHAVTLRKHLASVPPAQRRVELIPRGLKSLLTLLWRRVAKQPIATCGLGILCAAREPLSLDELSVVADWNSAQREQFAQTAFEFLIETRRNNGVAEYRLHHDSIRAHLVEQLGASIICSHHAALAQKLATWPVPSDPTARRYALRHALAHRAEAGDWAQAGQLASDFGFLEAKCRELGVYDIDTDVARIAQWCRANGDEAVGRNLSDLAYALTRESHWLRDDPSVLVAQLWNRLRRIGWSEEALYRWVRLPSKTAEFIRVRYVVSRESRALLRNLIGHTNRVRACVVTPNGRHVISASDDKLLKVWDLDTGRILATLAGHTREMTSCTVTPDGRRVVSASLDNTLKVWDLDTSRVLATLAGHTGWVNSCAVTPDDQRVISASSDNTLKVWDLDTGRVLATLAGHTGWVNNCTVTPDGQRVVSASSDNTLKLWDLDTGRALTTFEGHTGNVNSCAVTPDGRRMVSASSDNTLKVWDLDTGRLLTTLVGHTGWVNSCIVPPDGQRVASASSDNTIKIWELDTGRILTTLEGHTGWVNSCAVTPDGQRVISASHDNTVKIWDLDAGDAVTGFEGHTGWVSSCVVFPDGRRMVSTSDDNTLKLWDLATGRVVTTFEGHTGWVSSCAVLPDGRRMVSASADNTLKFWDLATNRLITTFTGHTEWVNSCAVLPNGQGVVSASADRTLKVWDLNTGHLMATLEGHITGVFSCAVLPDGRRVVSASADNTLKVWDLDTGRVVMTLGGHTGMVISCTVTPDGRRVISTSSDNTLKVWDLDTGRTVTALQGHIGWVNSCAVTPDGRHVVSASSDSTIKIWDLNTYKCVATHRGDTRFIAVVATATMICAGDASGTLWFLDWPPSLVSSSPVLKPNIESSSAPHSAKRSREQNVHTPKHLILFLAANPCDTNRLALDEECASVERELRMSTHRDDFEFRSKWAVTVDEMARHLMELDPTIIHFSGHGVGGNATHTRHRDIDSANTGHDVGGIYLQGEHDESHLVTARALAMMIKSAATSARILVLNACYSDAQADELCTAIDCVVGMTGAIEDTAARSFAIAFYRALGNRRSVKNAIDHAVATLAAKQLPDEHLPRCRTRDEVDPHQLVLGVPERTDS